MALVEGCKHSLEITIPVEDVQHETEKVVEGIRAKVRLPGFRPGKAPASLVRQRFQQDIRQEVLEKILPRFFRKEVDKENLQVVGTPDVTDVHFHDGEPLRFKAEFEVAPDVPVTAETYRGIEVEYAEPVITEEDIDKRVEQIRDQKADYVNQDPRALADGDFAVISLSSVSGIEPPIEQDDLSLEVNGADTLAGFTESLRGMSPEEEKEITVTYPDDFGSEKLAGKTITFHVKLKAVRTKELPELNDEFAQDLGDYKNMDEVRQAVRRAMQAEKDQAAQNEAKNRLIEKLVDSVEFPVPEAFVDRQIEGNVENQLRSLAGRGVDPKKLKLDWSKIKEAQRERALREVKGSLILEKVADSESIHATQDEVDREVQRHAKQEREPVAAVRMKMEKDGTLGRLAARIRTEKVLQFLFDNAHKVAPVESAA